MSCAQTVSAPGLEMDASQTPLPTADASAQADAGDPVSPGDAGVAPGPDASVVTPEDAGTSEPECLSDINCPQGQYCLDSRCVDQCVDDSGCPDGAICDVTGRCREGCRNDEACGAGSICVDESCVPGCRNDEACEGNQICAENRCVDGCRGDGGRRARSAEMTYRGLSRRRRLP